MAHTLLVLHAVLWLVLPANIIADTMGATDGLSVADIDRNRILKIADAALALQPVTITSYRAKLSSGGPNDFYSNGDYWWPDPAKPDGLPYIRRDGQSNPDNFFHHRLALRTLKEAVASLAAAYKITHKEPYGRKAAELLQVFFLDPATRMHPHMEYSQAIPGITPGRGIGIIDALHLIEIPSAVNALQECRALTPAMIAGLKKWFADFLVWMLTSKNGKEEEATTNNHSVAYYVQVAVFADFTDDEQVLAACRKKYKEEFVAKQMALDGSFPAELARTKPYGYSIFQLDNMATLCQVLSTPQDDLWQYELADGRGIKKAMEYLFPYVQDKSKWPLKPDIEAWDSWPARQSCLLLAGLAFKDVRYLELWRQLPADPTNDEVRRNIAITQPLLWLKNS